MGERPQVLIDVNAADWMTDAEAAAILRPLLPEAEVVEYAAGFDPARVAALATSTLREGLPGRLPALRLIQRLGAGVETLLAAEGLPEDVRIARLRPDVQAAESAEYVLGAVIEARRFAIYRARQAARRWETTPVVPAAAARALVLGLGVIGGPVAAALAGLGLQVDGWRRSEGPAPAGVTAHWGAAALDRLLGEADHVACVLPSTPRTRGLFDAARLSRMRPGAQLINVGRGDLIDEAALRAALDAGRPGSAVLDVAAEEPMGVENPLWAHPRVAVTPHVSGWNLGDGYADVAENVRRVLAGAPLLHEVDRARGY